MYARNEHVAVEEIPFADALECARAGLFATGSAFAPATADEIAGLDDVVARVDELVRWLADAERFARHGARLEPGVLFAGPPGTGKTLLARYLATASGARFVDVRDFPFEGDELGEADVAALFRHARAARERDGAPVVLFWDELDELCEATFGPRASRPRVVSALLAELDGIRGKAAGGPARRLLEPGGRAGSGPLAPGANRPADRAARARSRRPARAARAPARPLPRRGDGRARRARAAARRRRHGRPRSRRPSPPRGARPSPGRSRPGVRRS